MTKYRIKQSKSRNGTDQFLVEKKGWFFWTSLFYKIYPPGVSTKTYFISFEEAKYALEKHLSEKQNAKIKPKIVWKNYE